MRCSYNHGRILVTVSLAFKAHVAYRRISTLYSLYLNYNSPCFSSASQVCLFSLEAGKRNGTVLCFVVTHKSKGGWSHKFNFIGRRWSLFLFKVFLYSFMPRCFMHLHDMNSQALRSGQVPQILPRVLGLTWTGLNVCEWFQL